MKMYKRLSDEEVKNLIADIEAGGVSYAKLAKKYGVCAYTVNRYKQTYLPHHHRNKNGEIVSQAECETPDDSTLTTQSFKIGVDVDAMVFAALIDTADKIARNVADNTYDSVYDSTMETLCARYNIERGKYDVPKV